MSDQELGLIDIKELFVLLPHRYPFLLIDKIINVQDDVKAVGIKNVTFNEPHFGGHFPGDPIMPGVLIVEAFGQAAAALTAHGIDPKEYANKLVYLMGVDKARFRSESKFALV